MLISLEKKFIFIHVPKTPGSSIARALMPYCLSPRKTQYRRLLSHLPIREDASKAWLRTHDTATWIRRKIPREFETFFKFAVVRNPYDYAVSYYHFIRANKASKTFRRAQDWTFNDFLEYMLRRRKIRDFTQSNWVISPDGRIIVDKILRFESISKDFQDLMSHIRIDEFNLPHINTTTHSHFMKYYSNNEIYLANKIFQKDFVNFGYTVLDSSF